jgi:hypothetical protein
MVVVFGVGVDTMRQSGVDETVLQAVEKTYITLLRTTSCSVFVIAETQTKLLV